MCLRDDMVMMIAMMIYDVEDEIMMFMMMMMMTMIMEHDFATLHICSLLITLFDCCLLDLLPY